MPKYEYRCESNGCLVEVRHNMAERVSWGAFFASEPACAAPGCGNGPCGNGACGIGE